MMKRRCFHLSVSSPTNDYGPDFLLVEIGEQDVTRIKGMMDALAELDADGLVVLDGRPEWYLGDPEYAAEEIFASGDGLDLAAFLDEEFTSVNVEASRMMITRQGVSWEAESAGGDLFRSERLTITRLTRDLDILTGLVRPDSEPLSRLKQLIEEGAEFPDALWSVSQQFGLSNRDAEQLRTDYDLACAMAS